MATNNLAGSSPANTYTQLLHCGTGTLAAGFSVRLGDGTATPLTISPTGISAATVAATTSITTPLINATTVAATTATASTSLTTPLAKIGTGAALTSLTTSATAARAVVLADADGTIYPMVCKKISAATVTAATTTNVALSEFDFVPVSGKSYLIEISLVCSTVATTTGIVFANTGGAGTLYLWEPSSALGILVTGGSYATTASPTGITAGGKFVILLKGVFTASSAATLQFAIKSEVASSAVSVYPESYALITAIA